MSGGGLESRCVGRVYVADGAVRLARHHPQRTLNTTRCALRRLFVQCCSCVGPMWDFISMFCTETTTKTTEFYVLLTVHIITILVNNQLDAQLFFLIFVYSISLHVSSNQVLIIRRVSCINTTSGICHCMQVEMEPVLLSRTGSISTCIPQGHLHTVKYTSGRIDTIDSPDDEHTDARNM